MPRAIHHLANFRHGDDLPGDWSAACRRFLTAHPGGGWELRLPGGTCDLFPEVAPELQIFPSNNDAGRVKVPFLLRDISDAVIQGAGTRLVVRGTPLAGRGRIATIDAPMVPVVMERCRDVSLRGISIDWRTPFIAQARVVAASPGELELAMDWEGRWFAWNGRLFIEGEGWTRAVQRVSAIDAVTGAIRPGSGDNCGNGYEYNWWFESVGSGRVRMRGAFGVQPQPGDLLSCWLTGFDCNGRHSPAVFIEGSTRIDIEDVAIHHAWGMGLIAQNSADVTLRRVVVEPTPGTGRRFSLSADATHFSGCRGAILIEDCRFQNQLDDAVSAHNNYMLVVRPLGARRLRLCIADPQHQGVVAIRAGDRLALVDPRDASTVAEVQVASVQAPNSETLDVELAADLPADLPGGLLVDNACQVADLTVRRCIFRWNRARSIIAMVRGRIRIEDNHLESPGASIRCELGTEYSRESTPFTDLRIAGNRFVRCLETTGAGPTGWGGAVIDVDPVFPARGTRVDPLYANLAVIGNAVTGCGSPFISAPLVDGVEIRGNTGDRPLQVRLDRCRQVVSDLPVLGAG